MRQRISKSASLELIAATRERYKLCSKTDKGRILDEFVALSGLSRKRAIQVILYSPTVVLKRTRNKGRLYEEAVRQALVILWEASDRVCGKRLKALVPVLVESLERHGHLHLEPEIRGLLLTASASTIDRLLAPTRMEVRGKSQQRIKSNAKVRAKVAIRTFADWDAPAPGFIEMDCVAHCGSSMAGSFIHSLVLTDLASGWTECIPLVVRTGQMVVDAVTTVRRMLPFPLLGIDVDNGSEFLNEPMLAYCTENQLVFTRGRPHHKNDQAWIEQKNGAIVRRMLGYARYEGLPVAKAISRLYAAVRLYVNFFQPSFKLDSKTRVGSTIKKCYHPPATPCQRLADSKSIPANIKVPLLATATQLDPLQLLEEIRVMQDHIARLAEGEVLPIPPHRDPDLDLFVKSLATAWKGGEVRRTHQKPDKPIERYWRTREDPFEEAWPTVQAWLEGKPDSTAKALFHRLQGLCPGLFPDSQMRTLQRRVREWRCAEARRLIFAADEHPVDSGRATPSLRPPDARPEGCQ